MKRANGRWRVATAMVAGVMAAALAGAACSSGRGSARGSFESLLSLIPDQSMYRASVVVRDDDALLALSDATPPATLTSQQQVRDFVATVSAPKELGVPVGFGFLGFNSASGLPRVALNLQQALGIGPGDVAQSIEAGSNVPPHEIAAISGQFDPAAADRLLRQCAGCLPVQRESHAGRTYYVWGKDFAQSIPNRYALPAYDELGRGGRVAVEDRFVLRSLSSPEMNAMLDAQSGDGSLADDPDFRTIVRDMEATGVVAGLLSDQTVSVGDAAKMEQIGGANLQARARKAWSTDATPLEPYRAWGLGVGVDSRHVPFTEIWLAHESKQGAQANQGLLLQRLRSVMPLFGTVDTWAARYRRIETHVDGNVLRVRLIGEATWSADAPLFLHEPLLAHR